MKFDWFTKIIFGLCAIVLVWLIIFAYSESGKCIMNPYVYQAQKMGNISCNCIQDNNIMCPTRFDFNTTGIHFSVTVCGQSVDYFDIPNITIGN